MAGAQYWPAYQVTSIEYYAWCRVPGLAPDYFGGLVIRAGGKAYQVLHGPIEEGTGATECDNPLSSREIHLAPAGPEALEGDASSDATSEGVLHESVA